MYHDVVLWMMKKDLLVALHLRVRIVATREVKVRVREMRERWIRRRKRRGMVAVRAEERPFGEAEAAYGVYYDFRDGPRNGVRRHDQTRGSRVVWEDLNNEKDGYKGTDLEDEEEEEDTDENEEADQDSGWDTSLEEGDNNINDLSACIISDPGKATPLERRWLVAMSVGKDPEIVRRFESCVFFTVITFIF